MEEEKPRPPAEVEEQDAMEVRRFTQNLEHLDPFVRYADSVLARKSFTFGEWMNKLEDWKRQNSPRWESGVELTPELLAKSREIREAARAAADAVP